MAQEGILEMEGHFKVILWITKVMMSKGAIKNGMSVSKVNLCRIYDVRIDVNSVVQK